MSAEMKSGFISIIGRPNVGKSTLLNRLIGEKVAITSNKPQTTRDNIRGIYTDEEKGQIVFVDTPGLTGAKNKLGEHMVNAAQTAMRDVDAIVWLVEPDEKIGPGDKKIAASLQGREEPVILCINKTDTVNRDVLLPVIDGYRKLLEFHAIIPTCARSGDGVDDLLKELFKLLPEGPLYYDPEQFTDQTERALVAELIREKALHALSQEVPHGIAVSVEKMKHRKKKDIFDIEAEIFCEKKSHKGIIIGKNGSMLKKIGKNARFEIERMLGCDVNLQLYVRTKEHWRDSDTMVANFGYRNEE